MNHLEKEMQQLEEIYCIGWRKGHRDTVHKLLTLARERTQ
jgi:hypothetical protein